MLLVELDLASLTPSLILQHVSQNLHCFCSAYTDDKQLCRRKIWPDTCQNWGQRTDWRETVSKEYS